MIGSMWNGVSGIDTYQKALDTESNNIANVNTVAFKSDNISFADMLYKDGNGFSTGIGTGSSVESIDKNFKQGHLKETGNSFDMAIIGSGFFTVQDINEDTFYTRAGNFKTGIDGNLQTADGLTVMGLPMEIPTVTATNALTTFGDTHTKNLGSQIISTPTEIITINAKATDYTQTAVSSGTSGNGYKTASSKIIDVEALTAEYKNQLNLYSTTLAAGTASVSQISEATFDVANINDSSDIISIVIDGTTYQQAFDTNATTTLNNLSDQISNSAGLTSSVDTTTGQLTISSLIPGQSFNISDAKLNTDTMLSQTTTNAVSGTGLASVVSARDALKTAVENAGGEFLEISNSVTLPVDGVATLSNIQLNLVNLNISDNQFSDLIVENGTVYMKQEENMFVVGKVMTSVFNNNLALEPQGNNLYIKTVDSGDATLTSDNSTTKVRNEALEISNSDLSEGLVNLMIFQKAFEANSKSITTSDDLLKTAIQLKK